MKGKFNIRCATCHQTAVLTGEIVKTKAGSERLKEPIDCPRCGTKIDAVTTSPPPSLVTQFTADKPA